MRIAVVDDMADEGRELARRVESILSRRRLDGQVFIYEDGDAFLAAAKTERFQLAFLDIYMPGTDGVTAAKGLREWDSACVLVFTTTSTDHALDSYRVGALQYLVKPYGEEELEQLFDMALRLLPELERYIEVRSGRQSVRLPVRDMMWAENFQHQVHIHTRSGAAISTRMTFGEFAALLGGDDRFFVCGRGLLVNLDYAADFDGTAFSLTNGRQITVSRDLAAAARRAFGERLFRGIRG